jgi:hypothetical protein
MPVPGFTVYMTSLRIFSARMGGYIHGGQQNEDAGDPPHNRHMRQKPNHCLL